MNLNQNDMRNAFCGAGKIHFENGGVVDFYNGSLELNYDIGTSNTVLGNGSCEFGLKNLYTERTDKIVKINKKNCCSVEVVFPNSDKRYEYLIDNSARDWLDCGDSVRIVNNEFYHYTGSVVRVVCFHNEPSSNATRKIIAYRSEGWDYNWIDEEFLSTLNRDQLSICKNALKSIGISEDDFPIIDTKEYCSSDLWQSTPKKFEGKWLSVDSKIAETIDELCKSCASTIKNNNNEKNIEGDDNMNIFGNLDFGKVTHRGNYKMTLKGLAYSSIDSSTERVTNAYVQYNPKTNEFEDVTPFVLDIDAKDFLYKMPVATSAVKAGDIILDMESPVFVKEVKGSELTVVDPKTREVRTLIAAKNAFNFNYVTKIVNLMDNFNLAGSANADNPFGNILPLMMLSDSNKDMKDLLPFMLLGNSGNVDFTSNPMMLYFLMKDGESNDMLPFLLMSNGSLFGAPAKDVE